MVAPADAKHKIEEYMETNDLTIREVARLMGVQASTVLSWLGRRSDKSQDYPSKSKAKKLSRLINGYPTDTPNRMLDFLEKVRDECSDLRLAEEAQELLTKQKYPEETG